MGGGGNGPVDSLAYNGVLHIKVRLLGVDDEELRSIGIWATIGHAHYSTSIVL